MKRVAASNGPGTSVKRIQVLTFLNLPARYQQRSAGCSQWHQLRHYGTRRRGSSPAWARLPYLLPPFTLKSDATRRKSLSSLARSFIHCSFIAGFLPSFFNTRLHPSCWILYHIATRRRYQYLERCPFFIFLSNVARYTPRAIPFASHIISDINNLEPPKDCDLPPGCG